MNSCISVKHKVRHILHVYIVANKATPRDINNYRNFDV